jgi:hypothetical protein
LKEASPIAASLYKLIPEKLKQYPLYRTITGEAIKMLKEGMEADVIAETLEKKYIDPLLDTPKKNCENRTDKKHIITDLVSSMRHFTSYPPSGEKRITRRQRSLLLQKITECQSVAEHFSIQQCRSTFRKHQKYFGFCKQRTATTGTSEAANQNYPRTYLSWPTSRLQKTQNLGKANQFLS